MFHSGCNVCRLNSEHQLLAVGTEEVRKTIVHCIHHFNVASMCLLCVQGTVECWDPRSHSRVGELSLAATGIEFSDRYVYNHLTVTVRPFSFDLFSCRSRDVNFVPEVTALQYKNALNLAVGTSSGQILLFDLRSPRPYYVKDHYYDSPIRSVLFHKLEGLVMSADKKIVKIWHEHDVRLLMVLVCLVNI